MDRAQYRYLADWNNNGLFDHAYSDITEFVLNSSWQIGAPDGPPQDCQAGTLNLLMDNSSSIFSDFNAASPLYGLISQNIKIRVQMNSGSGWINKATCLLQAPDLTVGIKQSVSTAKFTCQGVLSKFGKGDVDMALQENITTGAAIEEVLDADGFSAGDREIETGQDTLPKFWTKPGTSRLGIIKDLAHNELGWLGENEAGQIVFWDRSHMFNATRSKNVQATYGTSALALWDLQQVNPVKGIYNQAKANLRNFNVGNETLLATLCDVYEVEGGNPVEVPAMGSATVWVKIPTPSSPGNVVGVNEWTIVDYQASTDPAGSGEDITSDVSAVKTAYGSKLKIVFTNAGAAPAYLVVLRCHGTPIIESDPIPLESTAEQANIDKHGLRPYPFDLNWITDRTDGQQKLDYLVAWLKEKRRKLIFTVKGNYNGAHLLEVESRRVGDRIRIVASQNEFGLAIDAEFIIDQLSHSVDSGRMHEMRVLCTEAPAVELGPSTGEYESRIVPGYIGPPDQITLHSFCQTGKVVFGALAHKWNRDINYCELRALWKANGDAPEYVDLRIVAEGGAFTHNGTTQIIITDWPAAFYGMHYTHYTDKTTGRWYYAVKFKSKNHGWSTWATDGNNTPQNVTSYLDIELSLKYQDSGPPENWTVEVRSGPQTGTAIARATRPVTNGKRIWFVMFQFLDTTKGCWIDIGSGTAPSVARYDGSAVSHSLNPKTGELEKASGDFGDAVIYGGMAMINKTAGSYEDNACTWRWIDKGQFQGNKITGLVALDLDIAPDEDGVYRDVRMKIVVHPAEWATNGFWGGPGFTGDGAGDSHWQNDTQGDVSTPAFTSLPIPIPAGLTITDLQARCIYATDYSVSHGGIVSPNGTETESYTGDNEQTSQKNMPGGYVGIEANDRDFYLRPDGSDSNDGSSNDSSHAWLTFQHALDEILRRNFGKCKATLHVADGTYAGECRLNGPFGIGGLLSAASGQPPEIPLIILGNPQSPANVIINGSFGFLGWGVLPGIFLDGFKFEVDGNAIELRQNSHMDLGRVNFGNCGGFHIMLAQQSSMYICENYTISGGALAHIWLCGQCQINSANSPTVTLSGLPNFSQSFIHLDENSSMTVIPVTAGASEITFSGSATGKRFDIQGNSILRVGANSQTYLPGSSVGTVATGGIYASTTAPMYSYTSSSSGTAYSPADAVPAAPDSMDDEFNSSSLDAKWTSIVTIGSISYNGNLPGWVQVIGKNRAVTKFEVYQIFAPGSSDFSFTVKCGGDPAGNPQQIELILHDNDESEAVMINYQSNGSTQYITFSKKVNGSWTYWIYTKNVPNEHGGLWYMHLQRIGGTFDAYWSKDGVGWWNLAKNYAVSALSGSAAVRIKIILDPHDDAGATYCRLGFDWFRHNWLFLTR